VSLLEEAVTLLDEIEDLARARQLVEQAERLANAVDKEEPDEGETTR
jgi:hypothetical protein